jgi:hypothetical protein
MPTNTACDEDGSMTRPCEYGLALRRPKRLFGLQSVRVDGAPSSETGSLAPGAHGLPSTVKLAARGELGN